MAITKKALSIRASKEKAETTKKKRTHSRIISTWLKALRGQLPTKYKKVTGSLCKVTSTGKVKGHCCLGVLSDLAAKAGIIDMPDFSEYHDIGYDTSVWYDGSDSKLSDTVLHWAGLNGHLGEFINSKGIETSLAAYNDKGKTFAQIADIIESKPEGLFAA
jgi:hypothetical protein